MMNVEIENGCPSSFIKDETAQDLIEYSLLLAFIALAGAAAYLGMSSSTNTLWSVANSRLAAANSGS
jgi:Flp pilus assembly pilin Flp